MNKAYNRCLFSRLPDKKKVHQAVRLIVGISPGSRANNIYSTGNDKLTKVELYMLTSYQPGGWVIQAFSGVEKPFSFSDLAVKAAKSDNKKDIKRQRRFGITACIDTAPS